MKYLNFTTMKAKIFVPFLFVLIVFSFLSACKKDPIPPTPSELEKILSEKMKGFNTVNNVTVNNEGFFQVSNLNEEIAPYFVGEVIIKKDNTIEQIACASLLRDFTDIDTEIKFTQPDILVYVNKSAQVNIKALDIASIEMSGEDKLKLIYEKVYVARPKSSNPNWLNMDAWRESINDFQIIPGDNYYVIKGVLIKRLSYTVYKSISGGISATPTPIIAIDGKVFQESGLEQNSYEVFLQIAKLPFPRENALTLKIKDEIPTVNTELIMLNDSTQQKSQIIQNQGIKNNIQIKKYLFNKQIVVPKSLNMLPNIQ